MEQCDHRLDACLAKVVYEFDVVLKTFLIDRVIAATKWDNSGPREGKTVRFCAQLLQKINVLGRAVVGVARHLS